MNYQIIVCEDEPIFAKTLIQDIGALFEQEGDTMDVHLCQNGLDFRQAVDGNGEAEPVKPDLVFMDIALGDADGASLIEDYRKGRGSRVPVIFVSSNEDRVLDGFEVNALAFLFKRNYKEKLERTMKRFFKEYGKRAMITVSSGGSVSFVAPQDLLYFEPEGRKTKLYTVEESLLDDLSVTAFSEKLPRDLFIEVYKGVYVNVSHISRIDEDLLRLENGQTVPISRRKRKTVLQAVMQYMGGK